MEQGIYEVAENKRIAKDTYEMRLLGNVSAFCAPGQFLNIKLDGFYLRRPISVCDIGDDTVIIVYKTVGRGTNALSRLAKGARLDILVGLGNGYDLSVSGEEPLLVGGGVGTPPLYYLAKKLVEQKKRVKVVLGFNSKDEVFYENEFKALGCEVFMATADGSYGICGFATDALPKAYSYVYACGPEPMLKAVYFAIQTSGQFSFEERMGCGFGACMGCTCRTVFGSKRICKDGPVLKKEEILWEG